MKSLLSSRQLASSTPTTTWIPAFSSVFIPPPLTWEEEEQEEIKEWESQHGLRALYLFFLLFQSAHSQPHATCVERETEIDKYYRGSSAFIYLCIYFTLGSGSTMPTTTLATPAATRARLQGGVRPACIVLHSKTKKKNDPSVSALSSKQDQILKKISTCSNTLNKGHTNWPPTLSPWRRKKEN